MICVCVRACIWTKQMRLLYTNMYDLQIASLQLQEHFEGSSSVWDQEVWCSSVHLRFSTETRDPGGHGFPADTHWWMCHGNRARGLYPFSFLQTTAGELGDDTIIIIGFCFKQNKRHNRFWQVEKTCDLQHVASKSVQNCPFP